MPARFPSRHFMLALSLTTAGVFTPAAIAAGPRAAVVPVRAGSIEGARAAWRSGAMIEAERAVDAVLAAEPGADAWLAKGELTDAQGRFAAAADWYRKASDATPDAALRARLELRLAMIEAMRHPDTLVGYARTRGAGMANRIAPVLALLGRPRAAYDLAQAGDGTVTQELRLAQWSIAAQNPKAAYGHAWRAFDTSRDIGDRRYALALLVEAYRDAGDLPGALAALDAHASTPEIVAARVDLLLEFGRNDAARAIIERSGDPALRQRLLSVLSSADNETASIAEYRRLLATQPDQPQLYGGLAALYLARGDEAQALDVYQTMFAANRGRSDVLIAGARQMIAMGLDAPAIAMLTRSGGGPAATLATHLFLFETYLDQGEDAKARQELDALRAGATDPAVLGDVADGYERLGQPAEALAVLRALDRRGAASGYDTQVRIAELAGRTGQTDEAMARWRALWTAAVLPARRSYVERQIVRLARETGRIDTLAGEIDARLTGGTLRPGEIDLLVALRLAQDRQDAAVAAVRRYAARQGAGEIATLRQLATLYARMRAYDDLNRVLTRLVAIDPANRDTNVRQLILNTLRYADDGPAGPARTARLDRLMAQLDHGTGDSPYQFKATVYAMAALDDQAIAQLRAGLAVRPDDSDALVQLATALKKQNRQGEGIALLQYAVEHGRTPAAFANAIDSLIDLLIGTSADRRGSGNGVSATAGLLWAQRLVLERIATTGEDARLLGLLGDIAQARVDYDLQVRAIAAALPAAGDQRGGVLRELVTISSGSGTEDATAGPAIGDPRRKIVYGRRLIALRKSYPPEFYGDLGRTMLAQRDVPGAERAFAMMGDAGGLVNVDAVKGDAYAAQGYNAPALANYGRALLRDQGDADLIVKTSILRERAGETALARRWYWRGVQAVIARQPLRAAERSGDGTDDSDVEVRRGFATLVEGLLLTWPTDPAARAAMLGDLQRMFVAAVADVDAARPGMAADHPRLMLIVDLGHRVADAWGDGGMTAAWDAQTDRLFVADGSYRRAAALRRDLVGIGRTPAPGADWPLGDLRLQAGDTGNTMLQVALAVQAQDWDGVATLVGAALAEDNAWRTSIARGGQPQGSPPMFQQIMLDLLDQLPPDRFRSIVLQPLETSPARDAILFDFFRALPDRYTRMETIAGKPFFAPDALIDMTVAQVNNPLGFSARSNRTRSTAAPDAWLDRFSTDQVITLYERLVTRMTLGGGVDTLSPTLVTRLLARPMDAPQQARLLAILQRDAGFARDPRLRSAGPLLPLMLQLETAVANRAILMQAARSVAERYPDGRQLPAFLDAWFRGDRAAAYRLLLALAADVAAHYTDGNVIDAVTTRYFADAQQAERQAFMATEAPDPARSAAFYARFVADDAGDTPREQKLLYYRKLIAADPANTVYLAGLLALHVEQEEWGPFADLLRPYVDAHRDDQDAATMLALAYRMGGRTADTTAVAAAASIDPDDADWLVQVLNRARAAQGGGGGGLAPLFLGLYDAYATRFPAAPAVAAIRARGPAAAAADAPLRPLVAAVPGGSVAVANALRGLWRKSATPADADEGDQGRETLIQTLTGSGDAAGSPVPVPAAILDSPEVGGEIDRYLVVMEPAKQARQQSLYDLLARGIIAQGHGAERFRAALAIRREPGGSAHALMLALALADRQPALIDAGARDALLAQVRTMPVRAVAGRIVLARILARAGDIVDAGGLLRAATAQMLNPLDSFDVEDGIEAQIAGVLALWPDKAAALALHADLSRQIAARRGAARGGATGLPPIGSAPQPVVPLAP